jgi:hypothetical protein
VPTSMDATVRQVPSTSTLSPSTRFLVSTSRSSPAAASPPPPPPDGISGGPRWRTRPTSSTIPAKRDRTGTWEEAEERLFGTGESEKRGGGRRTRAEAGPREGGRPRGRGEDAAAAEEQVWVADGGDRRRHVELDEIAPAAWGRRIGLGNSFLVAPNTHYSY